MKHGKYQYNVKGCRCDICRAAKSAENRRYRERRLSEPCPEQKHGPLSGYIFHGCRCERCTIARHAYYAKKKAKDAESR